MQKSSPERPFFSILICTIGKEELTRGAIQSIRNQDYQDFEIIVTDTSGTDDIRALVAAFNDVRIHFFEVPDLDPSLSWEYAFEQSSGRYLLWYDDDNQLVPWALTQYRKLIATHNADVVSGNHVYYLGKGNRHQPDRSNALTVLFPYSFQAHVYDPEESIRAVYNFEMGTAIPRWHSAATFVAREICEQARKEAGYMMAPHMYGNFTIHPMIFSFAQTPVYDDRPLCVIGKFGSSMTQTSAYGTTRGSSVAPYQCTGVSEKTLGNTTAESYLRVKHDLHNRIHVPFNWEKFYRRYSGEILFSSIPLMRQLRAWYELWIATERVHGNARTPLRALILKRALLSLGVRIVRRLRLWNVLHPLLKKTSHENPNRKTADLAKHSISSIDECAAHLDRIMKTEWGVDIRP